MTIGSGLLDEQNMQNETSKIIFFLRMVKIVNEKNLVEDTFVETVSYLQRFYKNSCRNNLCCSH